MNSRLQQALDILSQHQWVIDLADEIVNRAPKNAVNDPQRLVEQWLGMVDIPEWWDARYRGLLDRLVSKNLNKGG